MYYHDRKEILKYYKKKTIYFDVSPLVSMIVLVTGLLDGKINLIYISIKSNRFLVGKEFFYDSRMHEVC